MKWILILSLIGPESYISTGAWGPFPNEKTCNHAAALMVEAFERERTLATGSKIPEDAVLVHSCHQLPAPV